LIAAVPQTTDYGSINLIFFERVLYGTKEQSEDI